MIARTLRSALVASQLVLLAALPLAAQGLPRAAPESVGMSSDRLERVGEMIQGYVDRAEVAGVVALVARDGRVVNVATAGVLDLDTGEAVREDAIFRIASMTKPVTSVAAMMLVEEGRLALTDPVSRYIPEFRQMRVAVRDPEEPGGWRYEPARGQITIRHLLTHRSGLTYGFLDRGPVGNAYRDAGVSDGASGDGSLTMAENVERLAALPLVNHPGTAFQYGLSTDVLGRVVEVISGMTLDEFFRTRIFEPLRMHDTGFGVPPEKLSRVAAMHSVAGGRLAPIDDPTNAAGGMPSLHSGGGGLYSTAADYARFAQMLLNGGELDGVRLLSPVTIGLMTISHTDDLQGPLPIVGAGRQFGLGFAVTTDPAATGAYGSPGTYDWFGIYGTTFFIDPREGLFGIAMIQLSPNSAGSLRNALRTAIYQAVTESRAEAARARLAGTAGAP